MKFLYIDNSIGSNANNGLTISTPWADLNALHLNQASIDIGDVVAIKYTGTNYTFSNYTAVNTLQSYPADGKYILLTGYAGNAQRPKITSSFDTTNTTWSVTFNIMGMSNLEWEVDQLTGTTSNFLFQVKTSTDAFIKNNKFYFPRTGVSGFGTNKTLALGTETQGNEFNFADKYGSMTCFSTNFSGNHVHSVYTVPGSNGSLLQGNTQVGTNPTVTRNIFNISNAGTVSTAITINSIFGRLKTFSNNTVIIATTATTQKIPLFSNILGTGSISQLNGLVNGNVFYKVPGSGAAVITFNANASSAPITLDYPIAVFVGNNAYYDITEFNYITFNSYPSVADRYLLSPNIFLSGNPFKSLTIGNADYCQPDSSTSAGLQIIGAVTNTPNMDIGRYQSAGSAAVPNAYDLRSGVTVGAVTGTLVVPSIANVEVGTIYDAVPNQKTGTYTGANRWTDPGIANVTLGVAYKANSLTNNRTGTNESTDPGITNVVSGITYKINSTSFTGTRTSIYPLLPANRVQFNYDRGDGTLGTDVGADFNTDPGETNVVSGINYKIANVSKTGSRTSIYALLPADKVESGYDRGNGTFGTNKGEGFNSVLNSSQIAIGVSIQNLGNTVLGAYTASERYSDIDLSQVVDGYLFRYNSLTNNREGIRTAVYDLLPPNIVAYGEDRGDGELGTYLAQEYYTELDQNDVKDGVEYRYASLVDNKLGNYLAYPLLDPEIVKEGEDIGDGTLGEYTAEENYTFLSPDKVKINEEYIYNKEEFTGTYTGTGVADYPLEKDVLHDVVYDFGNKVGTLGAYDNTGLDIVSHLQEKAEENITLVLGNEWEKMLYFKNPEKNSTTSNRMRYGIRPTNDNRTQEVANEITTDSVFEIKLMTDFVNHLDAGDMAEREAELILINKMEEIKRSLINSKFGFGERVRIVRDFYRDNPERVGNVIVVRAVITVNFH